MIALLHSKINIIIKGVIFILNIEDKIKEIEECPNCRDVRIKKFSPINDFQDFEKLGGDYMRCECKKRPIDIVMSHILKIMIEENIVGENATLRHNSPVPLSNFYYSNKNPQFISMNTLILLHPDFNSTVAQRLISEVPEGVCVLKGSPQVITGQKDKNSEVSNFELLSGDDRQINVMRTLLGDKIIIAKNQSKSHIEVATTTEEKLIKLHNYLNNNNIKKGIALDAMCGAGALGIYLLKYGFQKVIFNDINSEMIEALKNNLKLNSISENFEIHNSPFEELKVDKVDLCIIDSFPNTDTTEIIKKAEKIADNILVI